TAVKRPALGETPAKPREPYGVAELFRQAFDSARHFRQRTHTSTRRLFWTVGGAAGVVTLLASLTVALIARRDETRPSPLLTKVESYRSREEQTASTRLAGPVERLERKARELADLRNDPDFERLPAAEQDYVRGRLDELQQYLALGEKLRQVRPPAEA